LKLAFEQFDENGDDKLSFEEIKMSVIGEDDDYVRNLIRKYDLGNDNYVSFSEFVCMMNELIDI
jgi:Ca2+-binding EF-hand superfamily protein